jgi:hypothetical protein
MDRERIEAQHREALATFTAFVTAQDPKIDPWARQ